MTSGQDRIVASNSSNAFSTCRSRVTLMKIDTGRPTAC